MPPVDPAPEIMKRRGPEPLRRKRPVAPAPPVASNRRKVLNLLLGFATVVLMVDALVGEKGMLERMRARRQYAEAEARLDRIRAENAGLLEQVRRLQEDPNAIEAIAREELGLIRPGELLFIVRDARPVSTRHP